MSRRVSSWAASTTGGSRATSRRSLLPEISLGAGLLVSVMLAAWIVIRTVFGSAQLIPHEGDTIEASFAGLTDTHGSALDERALTNRYRLVTFGFTTCPSVCPLTLLGVHQALDQLGLEAARILPVFVTVDPQHDTPEKLFKYVNAFDSRIVALTGSPQAVQRVAVQYGVFVNHRPSHTTSTGGLLEHGAYVLLIDPQHRLRAVVRATDPPADIAANIVRVVRRTALTRL